jgi:hypothetical protein
MSGCWTAIDRLRTAYWTEPLAGSMLGITRIIEMSRSDCSHYDLALESATFLSMTEDSTGVTLEILEPGATPVILQAMVQADSLIEFERHNKEYPHQVSYARAGPDSMIVRATGLEPRMVGFRRTSQMTLVRIDCGTR